MWYCDVRNNVGQPVVALRLIDGSLAHIGVAGCTCFDVKSRIPVQHGAIQLECRHAKGFVHVPRSVRVQRPIAPFVTAFHSGIAEASPDAASWRLTVVALQRGHNKLRLSSIAEVQKRSTFSSAIASGAVGCGRQPIPAVVECRAVAETTVRVPPSSAAAGYVTAFPLHIAIDRDRSSVA